MTTGSRRIRQLPPARPHPASSSRRPAPARSSARRCRRPASTICRLSSASAFAVSSLAPRRDSRSRAAGSATMSSLVSGAMRVGVARRHRVAHLHEQAVHAAVFPVGEKRRALERRRAIGAGELRDRGSPGSAPRLPAAIGLRGREDAVPDAALLNADLFERVHVARKLARCRREAVLLEQRTRGSAASRRRSACRRRLERHRVADLRAEAAERVLVPVREKRRAP